MKGGEEQGQCPRKRSREKRDLFAYLIAIFYSNKYILNQLAQSIE